MFADVIFRRKRNDDRKYVCGSQATTTRTPVIFNLDLTYVLPSKSLTNLDFSGSNKSRKIKIGQKKTLVTVIRLNHLVMM